MAQEADSDRISEALHIRTNIYVVLCLGACSVFPGMADVRTCSTTAIGWGERNPHTIANIDTGATEDRGEIDKFQQEYIERRADIDDPACLRSPVTHRYNTTSKLWPKWTGGMISL